MNGHPFLSITSLRSRNNSYLEYLLLYSEFARIRRPWPVTDMIFDLLCLCQILILTLLVLPAASSPATGRFNFFNLKGILNFKYAHMYLLVVIHMEIRGVLFYLQFILHPNSLPKSCQ